MMMRAYVGPMTCKELMTDKDPTSLGDLVRLMRNSFAHGNITFLPGPSGEIRALRIECQF